jgi:hypothetical protein
MTATTVDSEKQAERRFKLENIETFQTLWPADGDGMVEFYADPEILFLAWEMWGGDSFFDDDSLYTERKFVVMCQAIEPCTQETMSRRDLDEYTVIVHDILERKIAAGQISSEHALECASIWTASNTTRALLLVAADRSFYLEELKHRQSRFINTPDVHAYYEELFTEYRARHEAALRNIWLPALLGPVAAAGNDAIPMTMLDELCPGIVERGYALYYEAMQSAKG